MTDDANAPFRRHPTGIPGLDDVLGGGLFVGAVYLIAGRPGSAKTTLSNQVAFDHVRRGGRALYVSLLAESHARMLAMLESMSFFRAEVVGDSLRYLSGYQALEKEKLGGLMRMLRASVRDHRATMLVIDGLLTASDLAENDVDLKKFIHEVQVLSELSGCTTLLLRGGHDTHENYPERTMADGLLLLTARRVGMRSVREIEVQKHRGSAHVLGSSFFEISGSGLTVFPRTEARIGLDLVGRDDGAAARVPTGVDGLDVLLEGGIAARSTTMLLGSPGVGKTLLGLHFLEAGARNHEPCLYFGFCESPTRIFRKAGDVGIDLASHAQAGMLEVQWHSPQEPVADQLAELLFENVRRRNVRRVFIDAFEGFRSGLIYPERAQAFGISVARELRSLGATTMFSEEFTGRSGPEPVLPEGTSEMVDNVLFLRHVERRAQLHRLISVVKISDHDYQTAMREFVITPRGVQIVGDGSG